MDKGPGKIPENFSKRYNFGKTRFMLVPWEWVRELAEICTMGADKYSSDNWKKSLNTLDHDDFRVDRLDSALRHVNSYLSGLEWDDESGKSHLGHAAWNLLCVMWYDMRRE